MILVTLAYMEEWTYVRTTIDEVMAIKPKFHTLMGYHIFLIMVLSARTSPIKSTGTKSEAQHAQVNNKITSRFFNSNLTNMKKTWDGINNIIVFICVNFW